MSRSPALSQLHAVVSTLRSSPSRPVTAKKQIAAATNETAVESVAM
jgi:hypothetical protein